MPLSACMISFQGLPTQSYSLLCIRCSERGRRVHPNTIERDTLQALRPASFLLPSPSIIPPPLAALYTSRCTACTWLIAFASRFCYLVVLYSGDCCWCLGVNLACDRFALTLFSLLSLLPQTFPPWPIRFTRSFRLQSVSYSLRRDWCQSLFATDSPRFYY